MMLCRRSSTMRMSCWWAWMQRLLKTRSTSLVSAFKGTISSESRVCRANRIDEKLAQRKFRCRVGGVRGHCVVTLPAPSAGSAGRAAGRRFSATAPSSPRHCCVSAGGNTSQETVGLYSIRPFCKAMREKSRSWVAGVVCSWAGWLNCSTGLTRCKKTNKLKIGKLGPLHLWHCGRSLSDLTFDPRQYTWNYEP